MSIFVFACVAATIGCAQETSDLPVVTDAAASTSTVTETATIAPSPADELLATPSATIEVERPTATETQHPDAILPALATELEIRFRLEDVRYGAINTVAFSPEGEQVAIGSDDRQIRIYSNPDGELLHQLTWHDGPVNSLSYSPLGGLLVSGGQDRTIQLWDPQLGERITGARTASEPVQIAFDPSGDRFSYAGLFSALGETRSAVDGTALYELVGHSTRLRSLAQSFDGIWIATGDREGSVVLHGARSGQSAFTLDTNILAEVTALAFSPDSRQLAVGLSTGQIQLWDVGIQQIVNDWFAHSNGVRAMVFTVDGTIIISGGTDAGLRFWDTTSGERNASYPEHNGAVNGVALTRDGRFLASVGEDATLIIWSTSPQ